MKLLGSFGSNVSDWLRNDNGIDDNCIAPWDSDISVEYTIPFRDLKPKVRLGKFTKVNFHQIVVGVKKLSGDNFSAQVSFNFLVENYDFLVQSNSLDNAVQIYH